MSPLDDPDEFDPDDEDDDFLEDGEDEDDEELACVGCGCTDAHPCEGGCIWATPTLCSRCV